MFTESVSYPVALGAGLTSFFSGCVLPLIPAYFSFITGYSVDELTNADDRRLRARVIRSTISFVLGFSSVFILMGATASFVGGAIFQYKDFIRIGGGILIIFFGLHITGIIRIRALEFEKRLHLRKKPLHFLGTYFVGMAFAAGWSPCIGPYLGSILAIASYQETVLNGMGLLSVYSLGLAIPFLVLSVFIHSLLAFIKKAAWSIKYINITAGVLLLIIGLLLVNDKLTLLSL